MGHFVGFPREISDRLYLLAHARSMFKDKSMNIWPWYADVANEGYLLKTGLGDEELVEMRLTLADLAGDPVSSLLNKLLVTMYATSFPQLVKRPVLTQKEQELYDKHKLGTKLHLDDDNNGIPYIGVSLDQHVGSLYVFGNAIKDLLPEQPTCTCSIGSVLGIPFHELDRGLNGILQGKGVWAFNFVKNFLKEVRPDFKDSFDVPQSDGGQMAGTTTGDFKFNDDCIPMYERWATTFGVYILKRPFEVDTTTTYRSGTKEYEVGDQVHKTAIFASRGIIAVPGISKIHTEEEGVSPALELRIPHLQVWRDSSGSMRHPADPQGAVEVLMAFILGRTYHANGAYVGGGNWSTEAMVMSPSRDLHAFYRLMCGHWGGGTVYNVEKFRKFMEQIEFDKKGFFLLDDKNLMTEIDRLPEEMRKPFIEKSLKVELPHIKKKLHRLDNVLITDGYIFNDRELLLHLQAMGEITRTFVFLTSKAKYGEWSKIDIPNMWVYLAETPADLTNLALGRCKQLIYEGK